MTGLPAGIKVELELTANVWTDVSADADVGPGRPISWHMGRTSPFSDPASATPQIVFNNDSGKYTPGRQILADGVTVNPFWPNLDVRKRIRISYTIAAAQYIRYLGYVKQWEPQLSDDGYTRQAVALLSDRLDQLSRVFLQQAVIEEMQLDSPAALYTMGEAAGSLSLADSAGSSAPFSLAGTTAAPGYATPVPVPDGLTGLQVPLISGAGVTYRAALSVGGAAIKTLECWIAVPGAVSTGTMAYGRVRVADAAAGGSSMYPGAVLDGFNAQSYVAPVMFVDGTPGVFDAPVGVAADGRAHHFLITNDSTGNWSFYLDGVYQGTQANTVPALTAPILELNAQFAVAGPQSVVFGPVAVYTTALTADRAAAHYAAGIGNVGETTGQRVTRFLSYAGVRASGMNIDPAGGVSTLQETMSALQPVAGKTVLALCQEVVATEGGGAAFYVAPDGRVRFADRTFRKPGSPALTVDAGADLDPTGFAPSYDELTLVNSSTVTRQGGAAQTFTDAVSVAKYGLSAEGGVTSYCQTDQAALNLAQWRVRSQAFPSLRLGKVKVDLLTATTPNLYQALATVEIGSRLRVTSLDASVSPTTQLDVLAEGWTETVGIDQYDVEFDSSPADNPARAIVGDLVYGRANPDPGALTLQTGISASATTIKLATSTGPTYTTDPTAFPQNIIIAAEVITLNNPPSGSTSPQTFTGVTRGAATTTAAAQTAGSVVYLWPAATACL
jgi:hypothetical protein